MRKWQKLREYGFTLIEMLLVSAIVASLLILGANYMQGKLQATQVDRASVQMQQIMNAALSYYVNNGQWPQDATNPTTVSAIPILQAGNYLPANMSSPWGTPYLAVPQAAPGVAPQPLVVFQVILTIPHGFKHAASIGQVVQASCPSGRAG